MRWSFIISAIVVLFAVQQSNAADMRMNGAARMVVEQAGVGESTLAAPTDLAIEGAPWLLKSIFPRVIRNRQRDFFGPFQVSAGKKRVRFVFLRYHRVGDDNDSAFAVQAVEVSTQRSKKKQKVTFLWEPPHRTERFPFCALLSWETGKKLQYECFERPTEPSGNLERQRKRVYTFFIDREDTREQVYTRECPTAAPDDVCSAWGLQ